MAIHKCLCVSMAKNAVARQENHVPREETVACAVLRLCFSDSFFCSFDKAFLGIYSMYSTVLGRNSKCIIN